MNREELDKILENHQHWLKKEGDLKADFSWKNLHAADLHTLDLRWAELYASDLFGTNFYGTDLYGADFSDADLGAANLSRANLCEANFDKANLGGANLYRAMLDGKERIRKGIKLTENMIGWKKCENDVIVKLLIPRGAIVFSINNSKCRTDKAKVLEVIGASRGISKHKFMSYYVGDEFEIFDFNCEYNNECAEGIHFFRTREEAENYNY